MRLPDPPALLHRVPDPTFVHNLYLTYLLCRILKTNRPDTWLVIFVVNARSDATYVTFLTWMKAILTMRQGAQPTCGRCRRLGNDCAYNVDRRLANRANERRLNETIRTLKEDLCTSSNCSEVLQD